MIFTEDLRSHSRPVVHFDSYSGTKPSLIQLKSADFSIAEIDAVALGETQDLLNKLSLCFQFPTPATNWDGALDWLRDLSWSNSKGYVLVMRASKLFWSDHYNDAGNLLQVWGFASERWCQEAVPFHLIFCED